MKERSLPSHFRWNFVAFMVDYTTFGIGLTFISFNSVLPAFVRHLTDSAPLIGLVATTFYGGFLLPQLVAARLIGDKPHKKRYMMSGAIGRLSMPLIALALWLGLARNPTAMLLLFFGCLALFGIADGFTSVSWFDILARAIPVSRRGRMLGISQLITGLTGIGVGALVGLIIDRLPYPGNFALMFGLASALLVPSTVALCLIREPDADGDATQARKNQTGVRLREFLADATFRRLIVCRLAISLTSLAAPFYVGHAADVLLLPQRVVGSFVTAQALASLGASPLLGLISERRGPRYVIQIGIATAALGPLVALAAHTAGGGWLVRVYPLAFVTLGVAHSTFLLGFTNYMMEAAPDGVRPAYIGTANTLLAVTMAVPILGGWLLEATSYPALFGVSAALIAAGFFVSLGLGPAAQRSAFTPRAGAEGPS